MNEFSRVKHIGTGLPDGGVAFRLQASDAERRAIAKRLELVTIDQFELTGQLRRGPRATIVIVQGEIQAQVVQRCVVTFEPVAASLDIPFERYFSSDVQVAGEEIIVAIDDEEPDPFDGEALDLGEIATEELALALDPYPRSPGADEVLSHLMPQTEQSDVPASPFARLQSLKRRDGD